MRHLYRLLILSTLLFSNYAYALGFFLDGLAWRATETNDWAYVNSETLPHQTLNYKTIDFNYTPGFRVGITYTSTWDALFSYTRFYSTTTDSTTGNIQPAFLGSVTAKPSHAYLYDSGSVKQTINYNIFDLDFGKQFTVSKCLMIHPIVGLMGGWINQTINSEFNGSTSTNEKLTNNFTGIGPKVGVDSNINLFNDSMLKPQLVVAFATSYLMGRWNISDNTTVHPTETVNINGADHSMGSLVLQGSVGVKMTYQKCAIKLAYEIGDWFDQSQYFDNDTGAHNNDLVLQGLTLSLAYD